MCHYITLVSDTPDIGSLKRVLDRRGRHAVPTANSSIQQLLKSGEKQYHTTHTCDCGTVLGRVDSPSQPSDLTRVVEKKAKSGWSGAKIDRWLSDRQKASSRPDERLDSCALWADVIQDVLSLDDTSTVGLIVHAYDGPIDEEEFQLARREIRSDGDIVEALQQMREDELLVVRRPSQRR